jgi:putative hydrolase of the HAD superfamily
MLGHLGLELPAAVQDRLVDAFSDAGRETPLETAAGVGEALDVLRASGLKIGIVCDVGLTPSPVLREHLERRGLLAKFHHWSFSDEVGAYKPDRRPFDHALAGLGVSAAEAAHVGDQRRTDVAGALDAGWLAVRYAGVFDDQDGSLPEAPVVVRDHRALPEILQLTPRYSGSP